MGVRGGERGLGEELSMITVHCNKYVCVRNRTGNLNSQLFHRLHRPGESGNAQPAIGFVDSVGKIL